MSARIVFAVGMAAVALAQTPAPLRFEVASIKLAKNDLGKGGLEILPGGGLRMGGVSMKQLISLAYEVKEEEISGGPKWLESDTYQVLAKPDHPDPADNREKTIAPGTPGWNRLQQRLQNLLKERCQLAFHRTAKDVSGYTLVTVKSGPKLQLSPTEGPARTMRSRGKIEAHNGTMNMLAAVLSNMLGRPVVDQTSLTGAYDYKVEYTNDPGPGGRGMIEPPSDASAELSGPSIFTALQEQLGLKLEKSKNQVATIVIDRVEKPSEN